MNRERLIAIVMVTVSLIVSIGALELGVRFLLPWISPDEQAVITSHKKSFRAYVDFTTRYVEHPHLIYQRADTVLSATGVQITAKNFTFTKPDNTLRIACIGGSTTEGAYPLHLAETLQQSFPNRMVEVMDWGCSGWTVVEMTTNYLHRIRYFDPDYVVLHAGMNDVAPRLREDFAVDYSHYRKPFDAQAYTSFDHVIVRSDLLAFLMFRFGKEPLSLHRIATREAGRNDQNMFLPPALERTIATYQIQVDGLAKLIQADGATPIYAGMVYREMESLPPRLVGIVEQNNTVLEETAAEHGFPYVYLQSVFQWYPDWFIDHCHTLETGNRMKASMVGAVIEELEGAPPRIRVSPVEAAIGNALRVQIHARPAAMQTAEVWVQADDQKPLLVGEMNDMLNPMFDWMPGNAASPELQAGPQPGVEYRFHVFPKGTRHFDPLTNYDPVLLAE